MLYELCALLILIPLAPLLLGTGMLHFGVLALVLSLCAMACNMFYQHCFEWLEARFELRRTLGIRIGHALGFELLFAALTLPLIAWWLDMGWFDAFLLDLALTVFFLVYTFCFNWLYDIVRKHLTAA